MDVFELVEKQQAFARMLRETQVAAAAVDGIDLDAEDAVLAMPDEAYYEYSARKAAAAADGVDADAGVVAGR